MGITYLDMAVSLDGFISGPNGEDGGLHDWYVVTPGAATEVVEELLRSIGAIIMGRKAFGDAPDGFDTPYKVPHYILTHHSEPSVERDGATFAFVSDGPASAHALAVTGAAGRDVCVAGGADTAKQFLEAGLLDEVQLHVVPVLLGGGIRLFEGLASGSVRLEATRVIQSRYATHLRYRVLR
jgi:dihydrofolate reductase